MKFLYNLLFLSFFQNQGFQMLKIYIWLKSIQSFHAKWAKLVLQGKGTNVDGNKRKSKGQRQIEKAYSIDKEEQSKQGICIQHLLRAAGGIGFWIYLIGGYGTSTWVE